MFPPNGQVKPQGFFPAHELSREKDFREKLLKLLTIHEEAESAAETLQDQHDQTQDSKIAMDGTWSNTRF